MGALLEQIAEPSNLARAFDRVRKKGSAAGVDRFAFLGTRFGPEGRGPAKKAVEAMTGRAIRLALDEPREGVGSELRELAARWSTHHGTLARTDVHTLPVLLGVLLLNPSRERVLGLLAQRRGLGFDDPPPWIHVLRWSPETLPPPA
ncbi:MAG: hypothetical protein HYV07_32690 [Deltaproteobacteria bacterium]|nr:hypothetical protein [Deltaproteobacteria bacterium]